MMKKQVMRTLEQVLAMTTGQQSVDEAQLAKAEVHPRFVDQEPLQQGKGKVSHISFCLSIVATALFYISMYHW
jgi:hypothetical protein